jgi:D-glycerate 3-kinase
MQLTHDEVKLFTEHAAGFLMAEDRMQAEDCRSLATLAADLVNRITPDCKSIGIAGAPGCGKSTLAQVLAHGMASLGRSTTVLSLDDYYLPLKRRERLAATHDPLFRQRGVPGTHELDRLMEDLDLLREGRAHGRRFPLFDKSADDRAPRECWRRLEAEADLVLLEGWCVGVPPQSPKEWAKTVAASSGIDDPSGRWQRRVHYSWTDYHLALARRLDELWYIRVPDWASVVEWRWQQECELGSKNLATRDDLRNFLALFEPMVLYMQRTHRQWADLSFASDFEHKISLENNSEAHR